MNDCHEPNEHSAQSDENPEGSAPIKTDAGTPQKQEVSEKYIKYAKQFGARWAIRPWRAVVNFLDSHNALLTALATIAIAALTYFLAVYANGQLKVLSDQLKEMRSTGEQTDKIIEANDKFANAAVKQADAAIAQALAAQTAAKALTEQLDLQREILNRTYRPHLSAEFISVGDFKVTEKELTADATFIFRNHGVSEADDVEAVIELWPINEAVREQDRICRMAAIWQRLHLENLEKQSLPPIYGVIAPNETAPGRHGYGASRDSAEFRSPLPPENPNAKWILPAIVGCIAYRGSDDQKIHYTRFLYWVEMRDPAGVTTFITIDPQTILAANVVIRRWPDGGNSED